MFRSVLSLPELYELRKSVMWIPEHTQTTYCYTMPSLTWIDTSFTLYVRVNESERVNRCSCGQFCLLVCFHSRQCCCYGDGILTVVSWELLWGPNIDLSNWQLHTFIAVNWLELSARVSVSMKAGVAEGRWRFIHLFTLFAPTRFDPVQISVYFSSSWILLSESFFKLNYILWQRDVGRTLIKVQNALQLKTQRRELFLLDTSTNTILCCVNFFTSLWSITQNAL